MPSAFSPKIFSAYFHQYLAANIVLFYSICDRYDHAGGKYNSGSVTVPCPRIVRTLRACMPLHNYKLSYVLLEGRLWKKKSSSPTATIYIHALSRASRHCHFDIRTFTTHHRIQASLPEDMMGAGTSRILQVYIYI